MRTKYLQALLAALLLQFGIGVAQADDLATSQMVDEARQWHSKYRDDLAADSWQRLLISKPQHGEALVSLGLIQALSGDVVHARELYARASRLKPPPPRLASLAAALGEGLSPKSESPSSKSETTSSKSDSVSSKSEAAHPLVLEPRTERAPPRPEKRQHKKHGRKHAKDKSRVTELPSVAAALPAPAPALPALSTVAPEVPAPAAALKPRPTRPLPYFSPQ